MLSAPLVRRRCAHEAAPCFDLCRCSPDPSVLPSSALHVLRNVSTRRCLAGPPHRTRHAAAEAARRAPDGPHAQMSPCTRRARRLRLRRLIAALHLVAIDATSSRSCAASAASPPLPPYHRTAAIVSAGAILFGRSCSPEAARVPAPPPLRLSLYVAADGVRARPPRWVHSPSSFQACGPPPFRPAVASALPSTSLRSQPLKRGREGGRGGACGMTWKRR